MKSIPLIIVFSFLLMFVAPASAGIDALEFKDVAQEKRYRSLAEQLRCLVCQNQSLADSNAELARDLRVELLRLINQGRSDQEIIDYLVARYGDFVRYKPPLNPSTWLLWFGPLLILIFAVIALARIVRSKEHSTPVQDLSADESDRLQTLLKKDNEGDT